MISTITTATVSSVTMVALGSSFALVTVMTLFVLLLQAELASTSNAPRFRAFGRMLQVGIVPLLIAFALVLLVRAFTEGRSLVFFYAFVDALARLAGI